MAHLLISLGIWPACRSALSASHTVYPDEQQPQLHPAEKQNIETRILAEQRAIGSGSHSQ